MDIHKQVKQKLGKLNLDNALVLILVDSKHYNEVNIELIKYLNVDKHLPGVYVTVNKPYATIKRIMEQNKINTKTIIFIDAISKLTGDKSKKTADCLFIGMPNDLTGLSVAMNEAVKSLPTKKKFLFLDSLSTLSIHNSAGSVNQFAHFLTANMREWGVMGVIISLERETEQSLIDQLAQFCDLSIELGGGKT